jgi:hypothetical protein
VSNRERHDQFPRCTSTRADGTCYYAGPCLECTTNRARWNKGPSGGTLIYQAEIATFEIATFASPDEIVVLERRVIHAKKVIKSQATGWLRVERGPDARSKATGSVVIHRPNRYTNVLGAPIGGFLPPIYLSPIAALEAFKHQLEHEASHYDSLARGKRRDADHVVRAMDKYQGKEYP